MVALADQAVVSATSLAASVLIGRLAGDQALGIYVLGFSVILLVGVVQDSLVNVPYTFFRRPEAADPAYAGGAMLAGSVLSAVGFALAAGGGFAAARWGPWAWLSPTFFALAVTVPLFLLRDWARRYAFAHHRVRGVAVMDGAASVLLLGSLLGLHAAGWLNGPAAILALGLAMGLPAAIWLWLRRSEFDLATGRPGAVLSRHWEFGRLDVAAQAVGVAQGYAAHWLLALDGVPESAGILAACLTVTAVANPVILGVNNVLMARLADARSQGGLDEVWRVVRKTTVLFALTILPIAALLVLFGGTVVELIYGPEYAGHGGAVALLAGAVVLWAGDTPCVNGLRALDRPDVYLGAGTAGMVVVIVAALVLVGTPTDGLPDETVAVRGAALAILLGAVTESAVQWAGLRRILRDGRSDPG